MKTPDIVSPAFLTITGTGFAATIAQILVLRELLALFYGNKISTGAIFACWLLWTAMGSGVAGRWSSRFSASTSTLTICIIITGIVCISIFWLGPLKFKAAIALSVMVSGAMEMVIQLLLLLTFQVLEGFVYLQLALVIAFYMAGLGMGTAVIS